jgi:23S rRNA (cytidine1920-2'-O)/16S rRNA (cytidine1409-2'-O)-methyltransferase
MAMVKPQFELGKERVGRGVVRDAADRREAILVVAVAACELGLPVRGFASSGLPGPKGNRETFVWCGGAGPEVEDLEAAIAAVEGDE